MTEAYEPDLREDPEVMFASPLIKEFYHSFVDALFRDTHRDECQNPCSPKAGNPATTTVDENIRSGAASLLQSLPSYIKTGVLVTESGEVLNETPLPIYSVGPFFIASLPNHAIAFVQPLRISKGKVQGFKVIAALASLIDRPTTNEPVPRIPKEARKINPTLVTLRDAFIKEYVKPGMGLEYSSNKGMAHKTTKWVLGEVLDKEEMEMDDDESVESSVDPTDLGDAI